MPHQLGRLLGRMLGRVLGPLLLAVLALLATPAAAAEQAADGYGWPLPGTPEVGRRFAPPASAWGAGHRGVDLLADVGTPVLAAAGGRVTYAGLLAGRGVVTVAHDGGLRTTYEPVDAVVVVGEEVSQGDLLGLLTTGHTSCPLDRPCLHWGLLRGSTYLDPLRLVQRDRLRLLPAADLRGLGTAAGREPASSRAVQDSLRPVEPSPSPYRSVRREEHEGDRGTWPGTLTVGLVLAGTGVLAASRLKG